MSTEAAPRSLLRSPHWGLWGTTFWGVGIFTVFLALQVATLVVLIMTDPDLAGSDLEQLFSRAGTNGSWLAITTVVTTLVCGALIVGVIMTPTKSRRSCASDCSSARRAHTRDRCSYR